MDISPAAGSFTRQVDSNPFCGAHQADQRAFALRLTTADAGAERRMLHDCVLPQFTNYTAHSPEMQKLKTVDCEPSFESEPCFIQTSLT